MLSKSEVLAMIEKSPNGYTRTISAYHKDFHKHIDTHFTGKTWAEKLGKFLYGTPACEHCGKATRFVNVKVGFKQFCCSACDKAWKLERSELTLKKQAQPKIAPKCAHPDCDQVVTKRKDGLWGECCSNLCKGRYNSLISRDKSKQTLLERYGVEHALQSDVIKQQMGDKYEEKHGVRNPAQNSKVQHKIKMTSISKYGRENPSQQHIPKDIIEKINDAEWLANENINKPLNAIAHECGVGIRTICRKFTEHGLTPNHFKESQWEREIYDYLSEIYTGLIDKNIYTIIPPKELDLFIPDMKIAIECNGSYWHTECQGKTKEYHLSKTIACESKGIHLIHIWEHDWVNKKNIIKSRLKAKLGFCQKIHARKCVVKEISTVECNAFMVDNHLQSNVDCPIRYGLFHDEILVASMTFKKPRFTKENKFDLELIRYSTLQGHTVVGGASRLFKRMIRDHQPQKIISYADKMWNDGKLYEKLGFKYSHTSKPNYYYTKNHSDFHSRVKFQKHKLKNLLETFDNNLTEWQNMQNNGYDRIWDCGNTVWIWEI